MKYFPKEFNKFNSDIKQIRIELPKLISEGRINILGYLNIYPEFKQYLIKHAKKNKWTLSKLVRVIIFKDSPYCKICGSISKTKHLSVRTPLSKFCCSKCYGKDDDINEKRNKTNQIRYGGNSPTCDKKVRNKQNKAMLKKYGVLYCGQSKNLLDRAEKTKIKKYGMSSGDILVKARKEFVSLNGFDPAHSENAKQKRLDTIINRYQCYSNLYTTEVREKMSRIQKEIQKNSNRSFSKHKVIINNKTFKVQGYEDIAIKWLVVNKKVPVKFIETPIKRVMYKFKSETLSYLPDLQIKDDTFIEVKSYFTLGLKTNNKELYYKNRAKALSMERKYKFILLLIEKIGNGFLVIPFPIYLKFNRAKQYIEYLLNDKFFTE